MVLRLSGEHEFPVPPLPVPPIGAGGDAAEVQRWASVRLFVQRAQAASAGFELTSGNAGAVAEICRRLDGLPLAIELVAARVRLLPPQALLARLDDRMGLLTGGARDLPERQRTLRSTLDWSFDLLSPGEQALFARLGVFAGTFDLPAAEAVGAAAADLADPGQADYVVDTLGSLVDSSLVRPQTRNGEPRFGLLETIREYALDRLCDGADWPEAHDRHAASASSRPGTRPQRSRSWSRACLCTARPGTCWAQPRRQPCWVTSWHCSTSTHVPASCSNRRSPRCGRPATIGSPDPSVCSTCWTWHSCATSSVRSG
jgi:predicted ATPase